MKYLTRITHVGM